MLDEAPPPPPTAWPCPKTELAKIAEIVKDHNLKLDAHCPICLDYLCKVPGICANSGFGALGVRADYSKPAFQANEGKCGDHIFSARLPNCCTRFNTLFGARAPCAAEVSSHESRRHAASSFELVSETASGMETRSSSCQRITCNVVLQ